MNEDDFEPVLGKLRARGGARRSGSYLSKVLKAAALSGGAGFAPKARRHGGGRGARGAGAGRVLASRDRFGAYRQRRVIVKSSIARLRAPRGMEAAAAHLKYLERDGVARDGSPGAFYSVDADKADGKAFLGRAEGDRHQFRFIVSPEDGASYDDLKQLTRRLMRQMEQDLGTRLDWIAVDHWNTGHPHTHILVRGKTDRGGDLVISRDYLTTGVRERAAELVALDLGPRTDLDVEHGLRQEMTQARLTSIDRQLIREMDEARLVAAGQRDPFRSALRAGRLQTLGRFGLAAEVEPGRWRLEPDIESALRTMGERGDIIRRMQRAFTARSQTRNADDLVIDGGASRPFVGRIVERGLADEDKDRHYLIVDGADGRSHYVDIGRGDATEFLHEGSIVRIAPTRAEARAADRLVAEIAAANGGRYSIDIHLAHDATATSTFADAHVRRLEALRRGGAGVERAPDGTWIVASDHLERATAHERRQAARRPMRVEILSASPLEQLAAADGATWLDRELVSASPEPLRDAGFGAEARAALDRRRAWLASQGLARESGGRVVYPADLLARLRGRELARVGAQLAGELGLDYAEARDGEAVSGVYRRRLDLASGRFALIEQSREFTLVPWRPVLDGFAGETVSGALRGGDVDWTLGRGRRGPEIA